MSSSSSATKDISTSTVAAQDLSEEDRAAIRRLEDIMNDCRHNPTQLRASITSFVLDQRRALDAAARADSERACSSSPSTSGPPSLPGAPIVVAAPVKTGQVQEEEEKELKLNGAVNVSNKSSDRAPSTSKDLTVAAVQESSSPTSGPPSLGARASEHVAVVGETTAITVSAPQFTEDEIDVFKSVLEVLSNKREQMTAMLLDGLSQIIASNGPRK